MAAASGGTVKSDHVQVRRRGLWWSGAALMSEDGWNADGGRGERIKGQGGSEEEVEDQRDFGDLVGCG